MRKLPLLGLIVGLLLAIWAVNVSGQDAGTGTATVVVRVPADARVFISDQPTTQTGTTRSFVTPPIPVGKRFSYDIRAEVTRQGQVVSRTQNIVFQAGQRIDVDFSNLGTSAPQPQPAAGTTGPVPTDAGWPRKIASDGNTITMYQPQMESWEKNLLQARAAVSVETQASPQPVYGVVWLKARTDVDKEHRLVTLDEVQITKVNFPTAAEKNANLMAALRKAVPNKAQAAISLDRLEANLAITQAESRVRKQPIKNDVPRVIYSTEPAILVLIDGQPALRQFTGTIFLRVINTRSFLLLDEANGNYYLHLMDRWMTAKNVEGPWTTAKSMLGELDNAMQKAKDGNLAVDLLDDPSPDLKAELENGKLPTLFVSTTPAELVVIQGSPQMAPIDGTQLLYVKNTSNQIIFDIDNQQFYLLASGRWFRTKVLAKGPWEFVPGDKVPADFAKIPDTHPKGDVLASVSGTPQAKEAVIANNVPQTATVSRKDANLSVIYDGDPKFEPIEDTSLQYAANTPTPVIQTSPSSYYACDNGIWFVANSPRGPWVAATSVPPAIYDIPPSNPLNYVTNVYVYDSTPDYVYCGYTPGYYGTCVAPWGGVVWGTGWYYRPWIGSWWFGRPWTYGFNTHFGWTAGGWGLSFGTGFGRPWWGPVGWGSGYGWGGNWYRSGWERGYGDRYANVHTNNINFNNFNVYNRWGNNVKINNFRNDQLGGTRVANIGAVNRTTNIVPAKGLNNIYSDRDGNVFRRTENNWERNTTEGWQFFKPESLPLERRNDFENINRGLNNDLNLRRASDLNFNNFHTTGSFGGLNGGFSGYHAPTGFRGGAIGGFRGGRR